MLVRALSSCPLACGAALPHSHEVADAVPCEGPRFGERGVRDPAYPCDAYDPGDPGGDCDSDGHYLCYSDPGCRRFNWESEVGLRGRPSAPSPSPESAGPAACLCAFAMKGATRESMAAAGPQHDRRCSKHRSAT